MSVFYVPNKYFIGEIIFDESINEVKIDADKNMPVFQKAGKCTVEVMGSEGDYIPHFHIDNKSTKLSACIRIFENKYFSHGIHKDKLNNKDCKVLNDWLKKKNNKYNMTNWDAIVYVWNTTNGRKYLSNDNVVYVESQPDYSELNKE